MDQRTPDTPDLTQGLKQALEVAALVAAPTTLVTALVYWFGLELMGARAQYFGLDLGTLGFSTADYLVRGVEAGYVPLIVLFLLVLLAMAVHNGVSYSVKNQSESRRLRSALLTSGLTGLALGLTGLYSIFRPLPQPFEWYLLPPTLFGSGSLLTAYSVWQLRQTRHPTIVPELHVRISGLAVVALILLSTFWGASLYADALGRGRAQQLGSNLRAQPRVTLYSERSLGIPSSIAAADLLPDEGARYTHRYTGLRLLIQSNDKYFLLSEGWTPSMGSVVVIEDEPDIRVEFSAGG